MPDATTDLMERFRHSLPKEYLAVVAMIALAMVIPGQPSSSVLAIVGTVALVAASFSRWSDAPQSFHRMIRLAAFAIVFLSGYSLWVHSNAQADLVLRAYGVEIAWTIPLVAIACWLTYVSSRIDVVGERAFRLCVIACFAALVWIVAAQSASANLSPVPYIDVLEMHDQGAQDLWSGLNPYTETVVRDSNPYVEPGSMIEGYFYTPSVLVAYSTSWRFLGDARWVSVIAVAVFLTMLLWPAMRGSRRFAVGTVAFVSMFVANHSFEFVINRAWTDFLALPFLLGSAIVWKKNPVVSAILLGAALSTKEYFILFLPVLLIVADRHRWKRLAYASAVVALTYLPFAIADPVVLVPRALQLLGTDRPDSLGLAGYGVSFPFWLSAIVTLALAVYLARRVESVAGMFVVFAAILSVAFLTGVQAFVNYWVAVTGVVLIGLWLWLRADDALAIDEAVIAASDAAA